MQPNKKIHRIARHHRLQQDIVDSLPWPHPRPAGDPRVISLNIAFIWVSIIQIIFGAPPTTVQGIAFSYVATVAFSLLMILCSIFVMYAAYCKSQYRSFGFEMAGTVGFGGVFAIYTWGAIVGITDWFATNAAAFAIALAAGNTLRAIKLIRRLW